MAIRFQADADFNQIIVSAVIRRNPQIDIRTATAANLAALKDSDVLSAAAGENRVLLTHDRRTMPQHFAAFIRTTVSPGVVVVSQHLPIREAAEDLVLMWAASQPEEWVNRIVYLPI